MASDNSGYETPCFEGIPTCDQSRWLKLTGRQLEMPAHVFEKILAMRDKDRRLDRERNMRLHEAERREATWGRVLRHWGTKHGR